MKKLLPLLILPLLAQSPLFACGGGMYGSMLIGTGEQLLAPPETMLVSEISRLSPKTEFVRPTVMSKDHYGRESQVGVPEAEAFAGLLEKSLRQAGEPEDEIRKLVSGYLSYRKPTATAEAGKDSKPEARPTIPDKFPRAFKLYEEGAEHWRTQDYAGAAKCWNRLIELPEAERRPLEAPTRLMLAKFALEVKNPDDARLQIEALRKAVRSGAPDPVGYAAATYQLERHLAQNDWEILENLLVQSGAGMDQEFVLFHVQLHCRKILSPKKHDGNPKDELKAMHEYPAARRLLTAYVLSRGGVSYNFADSFKRVEKGVGSWLGMLEKLSGNLPEAAQISAIAYQQGDYAMAARWLAKAPKRNPLAALIGARLMLREGDTKRAADSLQAALPPAQMPTAAPGNEKDAEDFAGQAASELAVLRMAQRRYTEALALFLTCGLQRDAAVVAERFLSTGELTTLVASLKSPPAQSDVEKAYNPAPATYLRSLLARRLMRENNPDAAEAWFDGYDREVFDKYRTLSKQGYDATSPEKIRSKALFAASILISDSGERLFQSVSGPRRSNMKFYDPDIPSTSINDERGERTFHGLRAVIGEGVVRPLPEIRDRIMRFRAGELALYASSLLPSNDAESAYMLWRAGRLHADAGDARSADVFYKMLCLRHPGTELGKAALKAHWFPKANGNDTTLTATFPEDE